MFEIRSKKILKVVCIFFAMCLIVTACGSNTDEASNTTEKDTLIVANSADPPNLDPHAASLAHTINALNPVYETLVRYDADGNVVPLLADSWEQIDDVSWKFNLKQGTMFHNGEEMKASDVVFSLKRATGPDGAKVSHVMYIIDGENCEVVDDYTVIVRTKMPFSPFLKYMPFMGAAIVSEKAFVEDSELAASNPCGTGPFKFVDWKKNDRVTYERNDEYWGNAAKYKNLIIRTVVEANSRVIELETGNVDIAYDIPASDMSRIDESGETKIASRNSTTYEYLGMNASKFPFDNAEFRRAIDLAINEAELVDYVYRGTAIYTPGPVTPDMIYFDDSDTESRYNPEEAKKILKELGIEEGITFNLTTFEAKHRVDSATIMQSMLKEVGININIKSLELAAWASELEQGSTDFFIAGFGAIGFPDPDMNIFGPMYSGQIPLSNYCYYVNDELDNLIENSRIVKDGPEREVVIKDIQKLIRTEVPMVPYANTKQIIGLRENVQGFTPTPAQNHFVNDCYFE